MPPPFFIVGPTSSGKTLLAAEAAARLNGEIISADAFQVYRGLDILTAKPPRELRAAIPHHLVDVVPVSQEFDVAQYLSTATLAIAGVTSRGKLPIVAGGTGLYVRALTHGLADLPAGDPALRQQLEQLDLDTLRQRIADLDPDCAARIDLKNKRRLVRALEVCMVTGKPFSGHLRESAPAISPAGVLLTWDRGDLHIRIHDRVEEMFNQGVVEEDPGASRGSARPHRPAGDWLEANHPFSEPRGRPRGV